MRNCRGVTSLLVEIASYDTFTALLDEACSINRTSIKISILANRKLFCAFLFEHRIRSFVGASVLSTLVHV